VVRHSLRELPVLRSRPADARPSWAGLHLTHRTIRSEVRILTLAYAGLWGVGLLFIVYILARVSR
jgi:hypothetical protein